MHFKRVFVKTLAVVMCLSLIMGLTGCKFFDGLRRGFKPTSKDLSESELARLVTNAIMDGRNVSSCFSNIPESQLDGLSFSVFSEYVSILRKSSEAHGTVSAFRILNASEKEAYFNSIDADSGEDYQTLDQYGEMDVVELCYSKDKDAKAPPVRFTIAKKGDSYSIAGEYINDSMFAYAYLNHYFDMIDEENVDGLEAVIKSTYKSDIYLNSVVHAKAEYICDYYMHKVKTHSDDYELKILSPTHVSYVIPQVFTDYKDGIVSKTVDLRLAKNGSYCVIDHIPSSVDEVRLFKDGESKLRLGSEYSKNELFRLLGEPVLTTCTNGQVALAYKGLTIRLAADVKDDKWTSGRLYSIVLRNSDAFSLGYDVYVGMNVSELLLVYPMFDDSDFQSSFKNVDGEFALKFEFDDYGNVSKISVGESVG